MISPTPVQHIVFLFAFAAGHLSSGVSTAGALPQTEPRQQLITAEKHLPPEWTEALYQGRKRQSWSASDARTIGMPVGGIAAGQLYLRGDGTLGCWNIFNTYVFTGWGGDCYKTRVPESPVDSGFAVAVETSGGTAVLPLNCISFPSCTFAGEYPIGLVRYGGSNVPVRIDLEAFSPFIPLNLEDSALPATIFHITCRNVTDKQARVNVLGWLENAVCRSESINLGAVGNNEKTMCRSPDHPFEAHRRSRIITADGRALLIHSIEPARPHRERPPILFEDFESEEFSGWTVEGPAFGPGPSEGGVLWQRRLEGYVGRRLANSFHVVRDREGRVLREKCLKGKATGSLTSRAFTIERDYITFYIGKGDLAGKTCINLLINGRIVRTATGSPNAKFNLLTDVLLWNFWDVREFAGKTAQIRISDDAETAPPHHRSEICVDHIVFCDIGGLRGAGSMALSIAGPSVDAGPFLAAAEKLPANLLAETDTVYPSPEHRCGTLASQSVTLAPGGEETFTFVLSWCFPNHRFGRRYANRFKNAREVATYVLDNRRRLAGRTRRWHKTFYEDSTLPRWLLFRLHAPVSNLATGTWLWWGNGRPWGWEGVGSCKGTCTHVYNYAQAHACLFPAMARMIREMQDFDAGFNKETGLVGFRSGSRYAADGQCGTVLKSYREHLLSSDRTFLKRNWPNIKKALEYCIEQDGDNDGIIENRQHNTYDISFYGANTFIGSLYLAALRAGERMAREMGDPELANRCRTLFESGRRLTMKRLWNGDYFIQDVDPAEHEKSQYGTGCLSDQLFGQSWAHFLGLGHLYPGGSVKKAYASIWNYNWTSDVGAYNRIHRPERRFASGGDAGLINCTWPKSPYLEQGVRYKNEVWTGIEYQAASGMIREGMIEKGLAVCRAIHDRYHPARHNPFNEVECGDHYARSLASWSVYNALLGYHYDGPNGLISFDPKLSADNFSAAFTASEGWGLFRQERVQGEQKNRIEIRWGALRLEELGLTIPEGIGSCSVTATLDGRPVEVSTTKRANRLSVKFPSPTLTEDRIVSVSIKYSTPPFPTR